jgi:hypothetical protein
MYIDVAVLELPVGDRYANDELWTNVDEQILPQAQRVALDENGLRVGLINGRTPDRLLEWLTSRRTNPNAVQYRRRAGNSTTVDLAHEVPKFEFQLAGETQPRTMRFEEATVQIQITPTFDAEGKVRLKFLPQIEFRDLEKWSRLNPTVALNVQKPRSTEAFPALGWEMAVAPNEYVMIGTHFEKQKSLGFQAFVTPNPDNPVQRLVAIRAGLMSATSTPESGATNGSVQNQTSASQASGQ